MDTSNIPNFLRFMSGIWVNIRIELLASTVTTVLVLLGVSSAVSPSLIGLSLTYAISMTGLINLFLVSSFLQTEMVVGADVDAIRLHLLNWSRSSMPLSDWTTMHQ